MDESLSRYKESVALGHSLQQEGGFGFASIEMIRLLATDNNNNNGGGMGKSLSDLAPIIQLHSSTHPSLRSALVSTAASHATNNNNTNNNNSMPNTASTPCVTINSQNTALIPPVAKDIVTLMEELHLEEVQAVALYVWANEVVNQSQQQQFDGSDMDDDSGEFVNMLIQGGKVGFESNNYSSSSQQLQNNNSNTTATATDKMDTDTSNQQQQQQTKPSRIIQKARQLYFRERSALLATVHNLICHRVEAYTELVVSSEEEIDNGETTTTTSTSGGDKSNNNSNVNKSAVLMATDQLIANGLVDSLIKTVKELSGVMEGISKGLRNGTTSAAMQPPPTATATFGTGLFGSTSTNTTTTTPSTACKEKNLDMEYALLGFTQLQRQIATECLFYLAYHTQLTVNEVTSLIDLVKDLTNGTIGSSDGLPLLDPLLKDVPSPYVDDGRMMMMSSTSSSSSFTTSMINNGGSSKSGSSAASTANSSWYHQQFQQQFQPNLGGGGGGWNPTTPSQSMPQLKNAMEWKDELITMLWGRGQPQLLQCVSTLVMSIVCAFDSRHVLVNRESHGPNSFGVGNALFPPQQHHSLEGSSGMVNTPTLTSIHARLDPTSVSVEESWKRRDVWGILLISYALLLRPAASQMVSPRGSPQVSGLNRSPTLGGGGSGGGVDVKSTFSKCLMVASQLKSLTFARLSLIPSFGMPSTMPSASSSSSLVASSRMSASEDASTYDFFVSIFAEFTAQYIDALCHTGNLPITRKEWYDEELNLAQSDWMEKDQRRQFGMWAGHAVEEDIGGPRPVNVMDRPDCLEDVFALISCVCACNPGGSRAFWNTAEEQHENGEGQVDVSVVLAPSRCLRMLDLIQTESDSALCVYLSFLSSLALSDGVDDTEASNGASMVHSFLCGSRMINLHSERHMHFDWSTALNAIRWFAEQLSPDEGDDTNKKVSSDRIRRSNSDNTESTYYYGAGGSGAANTSSDTSSASSPMQSRQGTSSSSFSSDKESKEKELDDVGRSTLMSLLCLISNVATRCAAAREYILSIQLDASDSDGTGAAYKDGSLEILFSLLTVPIPSEIQGLAFTAIANLIRSRPANEMSMSAGESKKSPAALRAWELLEICQFLPIKLLSQYSSYAAGTSATTSMSSFSRQQNQTTGGLPAACFPRSKEYMMIYQLEHVEAEAGTYPATEGFLLLLSTLIKSAGCPSNLGSQWRLRQGCAPYVEYVTDFVLPRATGLSKNVKALPFASVADECRLINRAMEVVEAVLVRYVMPPIAEKKTFDEIKAEYSSYVNTVGVELGLAPILSDIFCSANDVEEEDITAAIQDFRNEFISSHDDGGMNYTATSQMLEASFGKKVPFPKTPGFSILANLLSTSKGHLFRIITKLLAEHGGASGVQECNKMISSASLATSLFRETPPNLASTKRGMDLHAQQCLNVLDESSYKEALSTVQQSVIRPVNPLLLISCSDGGCSARGEKGASVDDAVMWRERTLTMSLRILCAAAAREEAFIQLLKKSTSSPSVVPTLLFKGPIHGSMTHRFVDEHKINVSKMTQLLTTNSSALHGTSRTKDILPVVAEYVGYNACSLVNPQGIAASSFSIISYISHGMPQADCIRSLCGDDVNGVGLTRAFSKGLSLPVPDEDDGANLRDVILDLILSSVGIDSDSSLNFSLMMLGLSGSKQNCFDVVLDLVADVDFVMNTATSSAATKCFELIFRVCQLDSRVNLPNIARSHQLRLKEKLRRTNFWHSQIVRYLGERGGSSPSILHELSRYFRNDQGQDIKVTHRNNDVLHCIAWLLKGVAIEARSLMNERVSAEKNQFLGLVGRLLSYKDPLLLSALIDLPLGYVKSGAIWEKLHSWSPPAEVLQMAKVPMKGVAEVCSDYELIDAEVMLGNLDSHQPKDSAKDWALAWNSFAGRLCASSHLSQAWSDVTRTVFISYPVFVNLTEQVEQNLAMNKRVVLEMLCSILLRLLCPSHYDALAKYSSLDGIVKDISAENAASQCATPLCNAVLSLTEVLLEPSSAEDDGNGAEEDNARVCMLIIGAISSCASNEAAASSSDLCGALLSCALARVLTTSETWCIISENMPSEILEIYANATSYLFNLSTSPVYASEDRYSNAHESQRGNIASAARSGLSTLCGHLNSLDTDDSMVETFCSKIFTLESVHKSAAGLSRLISVDDNVADLLQQIILLNTNGARLLAKSGITSELLSFAHSYAAEERKYTSSHMGVSGAASLKAPLNLDGHLSLLNMLLSSPLPASDLATLAIDAMIFLKEYSRVGERLLETYPVDADLTMKFLETLYLTYSTLKKSGGSVLVENPPIQVDESLLKLERSVLSMTYLLSAFPFPSELLPPLPIGLINVEKIHTSQMKTVAPIVTAVSTWWDKVSDFGAPLPTPPTGSSDAAVLHRYNAFDIKPGSTFSEGKYQCAINAAKCLDVALMFLLSRVTFVAKRDVDFFSVDAVAVAKGLCRFLDASRAVEDRLISMKTHPEDDITTLMSSSIVNPNSFGDQRLLSESLQLEKEYLYEVGSCLGKCAEKLINLALQDARRMSSHTNDQEWAYFVGAITPALDHTQVESKGVGCLFDDTNNEASKLNAQALRQELDKMKAKFLQLKT